MSDDIKIEKAIEIEDGKTYVLELDQQLSFEQIAMIQKTWKEATNSKLIVLQAGAKLARVGEDEIREQIAKEIEESYLYMWIQDAAFSGGKPVRCIQVADVVAIARGQK